MAETSRGQPRLRGWPRGLVLVSLFGALLFVCVAIYMAGSLPRHEASPGGGVDTDADLRQLGDAIQAIFAEGPCPSAAQASSAVERILTDLSYSDWSINLASGVATDDCVGAVLAADTREVILVPALSPAVRSALERVQENSYANCLTERQAADMLTASLAELGRTDFDIKTTGRLVAPTDRYEEVENHVLSGCWVYSTSAVSEDGTRTFLLTGPPPN